MPRSVVLGRRTMTPTSRPYIIAEIGVNHEGSLELAKRLIELAKEGGADGAKFQSYKADTLASKNSPAYWDTSKEATRSQHELFQKYDNFEPEDYAELARHAVACDIDFLSTPFDDAAVDYLAPLVPFYKIASADITNTPLLRRVARTKKPVVLSTGASNMDEIRWSVHTLHEAGAIDVVLLHCILNYPCENRNAHVRMITGLAEAFPGYLIGYSDHTVPDPDMTALAVAYSLGAVVLEKHFTHDKTLPGNDHYHAMDVHDLRRFVDRMATIADILGEESDKAPIATEDISRLNARRSIVLARPVRSGQVLTESDLTYKRPGTGVGPQEWDRVIGMSVTRDLPDDHVLTWDDLRAP
jgi:N-acetylneuraminate synthase